MANGHAHPLALVSAADHRSIIDAAITSGNCSPRWTGYFWLIPRSRLAIQGQTTDHRSIEWENTKDYDLMTTKHTR